MRFENQVIHAEAELRNLFEKAGWETFLKAMQMFALNRSIDAGRIDQLGLETAWRSVEEGCRSVERLQTEFQIRELSGRVGFGTFIRALQMFAESRSVQASNWSNTTLKNAWQSVETGLQSVEKLQDELDLEIAWQAAFTFPLMVSPEIQRTSNSTQASLTAGDLSADWQFIDKELTQIQENTRLG